MAGVPSSSGSMSTLANSYSSVTSMSSASASSGLTKNLSSTSLKSASFSPNGPQPLAKQGGPGGGMPTMLEDFDSLNLDASVNSFPSAVIDGLPRSTSERELRTMLLFSKDLVGVEVLPLTVDDDGNHMTAVARFNSIAGAEEAAKSLDGKDLGGGDVMSVRVVNSTPMGQFARRNTYDGPHSGPKMQANGLNLRQTSRFNSAFASKERTSPPQPLTANSLSNQDLPSLADSGYLQNIFSPQSPPHAQNNKLPRVSGKSVLLNDAADDEETNEILKDLGGYSKSGSNAKPRRSTNPQLPPPSRFGLSLATNNINHNLNGMASPGSAMPMNTPSTAVTPGHNQALPQNPGAHMFNTHGYPRVLPPVNPADQNPPCNTLYVGNLPMNTSEDELKALFSRQRGYKRLCFRTKQNGPMCFVEFEDVAYATRALTELYGRGLSNSVKGGIRLSFSKNPLGVRSGGGGGGGGMNTPTTPHSAVSGMSGMSSLSGQSFQTAMHAPPGLNPPGLTSPIFQNNQQPLQGIMSGLASPINNMGGMPPGMGHPGLNPRSPQPEGMPMSAGGGGQRDFRGHGQFPDFMMGR